MKKKKKEMHVRTFRECWYQETGCHDPNGSKRVPVVRKRGAGGQNGVLVVQEGLLEVKTRGWRFEDGWWGLETYGEGLKEGAEGLKCVLEGSEGVLVG